MNNNSDVEIDENKDKIEMLKEIEMYKLYGYNYYKHFTISDDIHEIKFNLVMIRNRYRDDLINEIKKLREKIYFPVNEDCLNKCHDINELEKIRKYLLENEKHINVERSFFKVLFIIANCLGNVECPKDEYFNKYCFGTNEYFNNLREVRKE